MLGTQGSARRGRAAEQQPWSAWGQRGGAGGGQRARLCWRPEVGGRRGSFPAVVHSGAGRDRWDGAWWGAPAAPRLAVLPAGTPVPLRGDSGGAWSTAPGILGVTSKCRTSLWFLTALRASLAPKRHLCLRSPPCGALTLRAVLRAVLGALPAWDGAPGSTLRHLGEATLPPSAPPKLRVVSTGSGQAGRAVKSENSHRLAFRQLFCFGGPSRPEADAQQNGKRPAHHTQKYEELFESAAGALGRAAPPFLRPFPGLDAGRAAPGGEAAGPVSAPPCPVSVGPCVPQRPAQHRRVSGAVPGAGVPSPQVLTLHYGKQSHMQSARRAGLQMVGREAEGRWRGGGGLRFAGGVGKGRSVPAAPEGTLEGGRRGPAVSGQSGGWGSAGAPAPLPKSMFSGATSVA